ncbi:MAG TPA: TonB family protein [Steroidobacteraceae bacterium]|nr:TonB family protein [Steroidobacteraceae bacterium]
MNNPGRRSSDSQQAVSSVRDRLISMLLLAALLHGLVILGVSFAPLVTTPGTDAGLEVLLVSDELPESRQNDSATYLSQRTQTGSGNTEERVAARIPGAPPAGGPPTPPPAGAAQTDDELLASTGASSRVVYRAQPLAAEQPTQPAPELPLLLGEGEARPDPRPDADRELLLRGARRDELYVTADTRAAGLAPYLDSWKRHVERIGSLNFPSAAQRQGLKGNPVVEVTISSDGRLAASGIRRSSGYAEIDAASLDILRLASPFEPFPAELAREYKVLHFAYEWQFVGGKLLRGRVAVP